MKLAVVEHLLPSGSRIPAWPGRGTRPRPAPPEWRSGRRPAPPPASPAPARTTTADRLPAKCPKVAAPTAANASWHSEICPDRRTSSPSDRNRMMSISAPDHTARWVALHHRHDGQEADHDHARCRAGPGPARDRSGGPGAGPPGRSAPRAGAGHHDQHDEEDEKGRLGGRPPIQRDGGRVLVDQRAGDADQQTADEGQRQVGEVSDGGRPEGGEDERW